MRDQGLFAVTASERDVDDVVSRGAVERRQECRRIQELAVGPRRVGYARRGPARRCQRGSFGQPEADAIHVAARVADVGKVGDAVEINIDERNVRVRAVWALSVLTDPRATAGVLRGLRDHHLESGCRKRAFVGRGWRLRRARTAKHKRQRERERAEQSERASPAGGP